VKRAALYLRVSTLDQHPETQLYDLRQMAQQRGYEIVEQYEDRISGAKARRPGLDGLMRDARRGRFDVVLVWACDRIARSTKHFLEVLDELNHLNTEFVSFPNVRVGTVKKSIAAIASLWLARNASQHFAGCGLLGALLIQRITVRSEMSKPSILSSPWTRGAPQVLFSATMRKMSSRSSLLTQRLPAQARCREIHFQYILNPA
jgi:hypothetical protein